MESWIHFISSVVLHHFKKEITIYFSLSGIIQTGLHLLKVSIYKIDASQLTQQPSIEGLREYFAHIERTSEMFKALYKTIPIDVTKHLASFNYVLGILYSNYEDHLYNFHVFHVMMFDCEQLTK